MAGKKNEAYIEFKANTSEFQKGIKQMNAELKNASNALRLNSTQLKGAGDSVDLLTERQNILQNELEASRKKVELTEKSLAECEATLGKNSKEYATLSNAVLSAKNQQQAIQNELEQTAAKLNKIQTENKQAATAFGQLSDKIEDQENDLAALKKRYSSVVLEQGKGSKEAKDLAKQIGTLSRELTDNKKELKQAETAADKFDNTLDDLESSAKSAGDGFTVFKGALSGIIANGFTGLVNIAKSTISSIANLESETREYRAEMGKLDTAFTTNKHSVETAEAAYSELYSIIGETDQSVEAAQQISLLAQSEEDVAKWADFAAGVVGRFGDALQPETFYESANETLKLGEATGAYTQMLEGCGVNVEKFNEGLAACKTEGEKQAYMLKTTESLLGEASKSYKETNADIIAANQATADNTAIMAAFGEKVAPVTTAAKEGFNGLLQKVLELTNGVDFSRIASGVSSAFSTISNTVLPAVISGFDKLKSAWQWIGDNKAAVIVAVTGLAAGMIALNSAQIAAAASSAVLKVATALQTAQQWLLNAAMNANPIGIVIMAITALVAGFMLLWNNCEGFRNFFINMWEKIKTAFNAVKEALFGGLGGLKDKMSGFKDSTQGTFGKILDFFKNNWKGILLFIINPFAGAFKLVYDNCEGFRNKVNQIFSAVINFFKNNWKTILLFLVNPFAGAFKLAYDKCTGFRNTVNKIFNAVINFFKNNWKSLLLLIVNPLAGAFKLAYDNCEGFRNKVNSFIAKIKDGFKKGFNFVKEKIITPIVEARSKAISTFQNLVSSVISKITSMKSKVSSIFNNIKTAITNPVETARDKVKAVVDRIKSFFSGLKISLPRIKVPKISISGKFSLNPPSVPKFSISWHKYGGLFGAGALFTKPTVLHGFGEAGAEYGLPLNERSLTPLATMLNKLTMSGENGLADILTSRFDAAVNLLAERLERLEMSVNIDGDRVATATASYNDTNSGTRALLVERGLAVK